MANKAVWIKEIEVVDPDSKGVVHLAVYKHDNGALFAIDSSYIEQCLGENETIPDPFNKGFSLELLEYGLVSYDGNEQGTYNIIVDGMIKAEVLLNIEGTSEVAKDINEFLSDNHDIGNTVQIQNDGDKLGVIVDIYDGDDHKDGITLWFDDYHE